MADLDPIKGSEQSGFRPVLVIQNDILNRKLNTVIVVPITSNLKLKGRLTTFLLSTSNTGLKGESLALLFQIRTIDKIRLIKKVGRLDVESLSLLKLHTFLLFK